MCRLPELHAVYAVFAVYTVSGICTYISVHTQNADPVCILNIVVK